MGNAVLQAFYVHLHQVQLPHKDAYGTLFGEHSHYLKQVPGLNIDSFVHIVCCPSISGSHLIAADTFELLYKVKQRMAYDSTTPRYDLHNVRAGAYGSHFSFGHLEKVRIEQTVSKGLSYRRMETWHASVAELEGEEKKGILKKLDMPDVSPKQAWAVNMNLSVAGSRDPKTHNETWRTQFAFSDPAYTMEVDGKKHVTPETMQVARIYHEGQLVCVARRQDLAHRNRPSYERPFLGIQLRMDQRPTGAEDGYVPKGGNNQVLPILLAIAWCEETLNPPEDKREHLIRKMRSNKKGKTPKWARIDDEVALEVPLAEGLGEAPVVHGKLKQKSKTSSRSRKP
mmetsp:Transcript_30697/g.56092  ORF Transcript_30697/g.56092 Transcript_30697/m.56092 type:complete len:341 (-) Transcript_30697:23-1045(-)